MTANLLRPDWATTAGDSDDAARGVRVFELPEQHDSVVDTEPARDSAWLAGYRDGRAEGLRDGFEEARQRGLEAGRAEALAASKRALAGLEAQLVAMQQAHEEELEAAAAGTVSLALEIAETVLDHHVAAAKDPGLEALTRALAVHRPTGRVVARLNPDDLELLGSTPPGVQLELVPDADIARGGCVLEANAATVDATLDGALARVKAALSTPSGTGGAQ